MRTCKYCGTELEFMGRYSSENQFNCSFCDLMFPESETCLNRKRKKYSPAVIDESFFISVKEMLTTDTITLFHCLKATRSHWFQLKNMLEVFKKVQDDGLYKVDKEDNSTLKELKHEYIQVTKQKFALENVILERTGFIPKKITEEFLSNIVVEGQEFDEKPMYIYIK